MYHFLFFTRQKKWGNFDIIHLNEITLIPNIFVLNIYFRKVKYIAHIRSIQRSNQNYISNVLNLIYKKYIHMFITIDKNVYESLNNNIKKNNS